MCGIVGAISERNVVPILLEGLKRLEYRGYDSAGVATVDGKLRRIRSTRRVAELEKRARLKGLTGAVGIAHTRWATHGVPSERNAHPHVSRGVSVVHNGIIENHEEVRARLASAGYRFVSETDTEVIAHLVHSRLALGCSLIEAVQASVTELVGAYAIAVICENDPARLVVARHGAPLLLGLGDGENFAASDTAALVQVTQRVVYLEDGDVAEITHSSVRICNADGQTIERPIHVSSLSPEAAELGPYAHYMQKEIHEQPAAMARTLELIAGTSGLSPGIFGAGAAAALQGVDNVLILACGTSYHAGLVARYWIEELAGISCTVEIASEYRYRLSAFRPNTLVVTISQSGETADTLAALQHAKARGHRHCLCICNVPESALIRASSLRFLTRAGPEIGVASTKAFTTQLAALGLLAVCLAKERTALASGQEEEFLHGMRELPAVLEAVLATTESRLSAWGKSISASRHALFLGRGAHYPIAMEGALKLKEISYIHAEAYAAGELKHGPLALVDASMPVIALAPDNALFSKLKSNLQEVRARGGRLYVLAGEEAAIAEEEGISVIRLPRHPALLSPLVYSVPLQLLAYHTALLVGSDVDKPRNLAKSVTVE